MSAGSRETATDRVHRVLAEVLWISERDGPTLAEAAERFGVSPATLQADLDLATMIGADSDDFLDMPVEVWVEGDRVHVTLHGFDRPLRLSPAEALALVVSGAALTSAPGASPDDALGRALAKVAALLDLEVGDQLDIDLGLGDAAVVADLQQGLDGRRAVEIEHLRVETDARTVRVVEPWAMFREGGAWYLSAFCRNVEAERVFRVDRIVAARVLDDPVDPPPAAPATTALRPHADAPRLVVDLEPDARWVVESYPTEAVEERADGRLRVTLVVTSRTWAERLLLRLGTDARVVAVDAPLDAADLGPGAARRVLVRYGSDPAQG